MRPGRDRVEVAEFRSRFQRSPGSSRRQSTRRPPPRVARQAGDGMRCPRAPAGPRHHRDGHEERERKHPSRAEPGVDRDQRQGDRQRQPRDCRARQGEVVNDAAAQAGKGDGDRRGPGRSHEKEPAEGCRHGGGPRGPDGHQPGRDRLQRRVAGVTRSVSDVVERPDRHLEQGHGNREAKRDLRCPTGDERHRKHDRAVEKRWKRVSQPDSGTRGAQSSRGTRCVRRKRAR